jgi:hypothetical protein
MPTLTLRPNSDVSVAMSQYGSGTGNYGRINESTTDDTNGVSTTNTEGGVVDLYGLPDPSPSGTINSVTVHFRARWDNVFGGSVVTQSYGTPQVRIGGTTYSAATQALGNTFKGYSRSWTTNPNTKSAWTWQNINDLVAGIRLNAGTYGDDKNPTLGEAYCSQLWVVVDYNNEPVANKLPAHLFFQGVR